MKLTIEVDEKSGKLRENCWNEVLSALQKALNSGAEGTVILQGDFYDEEISTVERKFHSKTQIHLKTGGAHFQNCKFVLRRKKR